MDDAILITELNDFIFCPASIYFHKLYGSLDYMLYQSNDQIDGKKAHESVDLGRYSTRKDTLMGTDVYCSRYRLIGKIDIYDGKRHLLRERKKKIKTVFDGYVFQLYAQCFALREMGYPVEQMELFSIDDHKTYTVRLPEDDPAMLFAFEETIMRMREFRLDEFIQNNMDKCRRCIYEPACDRSLLDEG